MKRIFLFLLLLAGTGWTGTVQAQQTFDPGTAHYIWPTEASSYLSSTFAETRSAHFHAALDIKTWGRRGYEVYATRDGIVDRIAIGPRGYGKVVYLKHDDGSYSVYAHLLSFNNELQQFADSIRFAQDYKFEIERFLGWKNIEVQQGDIIGYSGASGIGPPHLHFELRTPSEKPFNPLLTNLNVKDNIAPQVLGISIEPLSAESSIEGRNAVYTQKTWGKKNQYHFGTIDVSGPVGLGINAFDQSNDVHNSYAVYKLSMSVNGQELFTSRVDSFSYRETDQMFIDRVYPLLKEEGDGYQRLYVVDGNTLPFYKTDKNKGRLNLPPGEHEVTIRATDYYGNTSTTSLELNVREPKIDHPKLPRSSHGNPISPPDTWNWFSNWLTLTETQFDEVTIGLADSSKYIRHQNGVAVKTDQSAPLFLNIPRVGPIMLHRVKPNSPSVISSDDFKNVATFPKSTVYDTVSVGMAVHNHSPDSITVNILPEAYPLRQAYKFYIHRNPELDPKKLSFYKMDRDDVEWEMVPTEFTRDYIITEAESLGMFRMFRDTTAPKLQNPRLRQRADGRWVVMIDVEDNLSGIDYSRSKISVNGIQGIVEYEPEDDRFVYYHPNFEPKASMKIDVTAVDKMGNQQSSSFLLDSGKTKK